MPKHSSTCFRTEEENELLIIAVQDYPCLWDPSIEGYSRAQFRSLAWENVAERCGFPGNVSDCQRQWKSLREKFRREKDKSSSKSGDGAPAYTKKWSLYDVMKFIEPVLAPRKTTSNLEKPLLTLELLNSPDEASTAENVNPHSSFQLETPTGIMRKNGDLEETPCHPKRQRMTQKSHPANKVEQVFLDAINMVKNEEKTEENDPVYAFYKSMANEAKSLPQLARLELQQEILHATMQKLREYEEK